MITWLKRLHSGAPCPSAASLSPLVRRQKQNNFRKENEKKKQHKMHPDLEVSQKSLGSIKSMRSFYKVKETRSEFLDFFLFFYFFGVDPGN